ncbi:MAG: hypothetical protein AAB613_01950 [Patescibacteria group bacterium]
MPSSLKTNQAIKVPVWYFSWIQMPKPEDIRLVAKTKIEPEGLGRAWVKPVHPGEELAIYYSLELLPFRDLEVESIPLMAHCGNKPTFLIELESEDKVIRIIDDKDVIRPAVAKRAMFRIPDGTIVLHQVLALENPRNQYVVCDPDCRPDTDPPFIGDTETYSRCQARRPVFRKPSRSRPD